MAHRKHSSASSGTEPAERSRTEGPAPIPAASVLSFLKEMRSKPVWTERELMKSLKVTSAEAKQALAVLQLEGYIEPGGSSGKWRTTEQGEIVSDAKTPRFTRDSVEQALTALAQRIKEVNSDASSPYTIIEAVAFGDFLRDQPRVQAADVGVQLKDRNAPEPIHSARARSEQRAFLQRLRGKTTMIHVVPYEPWMSARTHRKLV